jgi:hypothetical protein
MKKKIIEKIYFFLILTTPIICGGVIIYNSLTKNIEFAIENELENIDDNSISDSNQIDLIPVEVTNYSNCFAFKSTTQPIAQYLFITYNIYSEPNPPPPLNFLPISFLFT